MSAPEVPPQVPVSHSRPVVVLGSVAAGGAALLGIIGATDIPGWVKLTVAGVVAVALAVRGYLVTGKVTPWEDVAAKSDGAGGYVAGPAAPGVIVAGEVVNVTDDKPSPYRSSPKREAAGPYREPMEDGPEFGG